jgi:hypothetical protein
MQNITTHLAVTLCCLAPNFATAKEVTLTDTPTSPAKGEILSQYASDWVARGVYLGNQAFKNSLALDKEAFGIKWKAAGRYVEITDSDTGKDQVDAYFEAVKDFGVAEFKTGYLYFEFFDGGVHAHEIYGSIAKNWGCGYRAEFAYSWLIEGADNDGYSQLTFEKNTLIADNLLKLKVDNGFLFEKGQFSHITAKARYDYKLNDNFVIQPFLAYTWEMDGLEYFGSSIKGDQQNRFYGGLGLSIRF